MRLHTACILAFLVLSTGSPAFAVSCPFLVGATEEMAIGVVPIGSAYSTEAAQGSTENSCTEQADANYPYHDCGYVDEMGIHYTVWGARITQKDLSVEKATSSAQFPFGISKSDDLQTVVGKLSDFPLTSGLWTVQFNDIGIKLGTHFCFINDSGTEYSIGIAFDRDSFQMTKMTARENW